jgi:hypothetical protein
LAGGGEEILNNFVCDVPAKNLVIVWALSIKTY